MGIWGAGPADNDDAADWLTDFIDDPSVRLLKSALKVKKSGYLDVDKGAEAVIAAEVLAQLHGHAPAKPVLTKAQCAALLSQLPPATTGRLVADAIAALERVSATKGSELRDGLAERKAWLQTWTRGIADLTKRLKKPLKKTVAPKAPVKKKSASKRVRPELGAIIAIPLGKKRYAFAKIYKDFAYGVYDVVHDSILPVEKVLARPIAFFAQATDKAVRAGTWPIIGHEPFPDDESAWGPPMAAGQTVAMMSSGYVPEPDDIIACAIEHKGEFRHVGGLEDVIGLDIAEFCQRPELFVELLINRLVRGNHREHRVFAPRTSRRG